MLSQLGRVSPIGWFVRFVAAMVAAVVLCRSPLGHAEVRTANHALLVTSTRPPLQLAPSVDGGTHWRLMTARGPVHVWAPSGYDRRTAVTVVFIHGYNTDVDRAWADYALPDQFARSGVNALFIACGAPASTGRPMVWPSLSVLLHAVEDGLGQPLPAGDVVAVGHSAAYRTLVLWLGHPALRTLVLLDAAYGEIDRFLAWTRADVRHQLVNIASDTIADSNLMHAFLPGTQRVDGLPIHGWPDDTRSARFVYVRTHIGHMPMITGGLALPLALRALPMPVVGP